MTRSHMFRSASRPFFRSHAGRPRTARPFHRITTDFITQDAKGSLVTERVPVIIGNPGEAYVLIYPSVGHAFRAASPLASASPASMQDRCTLMFFHDTQHFGFGELPMETLDVC